MDAATSSYLKILELKDKNSAIYFVHEGFFSLNMRELRSSLISLPLTSNAIIQKILSNKLAITIIKQPLLAQRDGTQLMLKLGILFALPIMTIFKDLPQLHRLNDSEKVALTRFKQFNQLLKPLRIKITSLRENDRKAWFLILNNHVQVYLGCEDVDQRFKKLIHFYRKIIGNQGNQVRRIDLRYSNGLAIQWRTNFLHNSYAKGK